MLGGSDEWPPAPGEKRGGAPTPESRGVSSGDGNRSPGRAGPPLAPVTPTPEVPQQRRAPGPAPRPEPPHRPRVVDDPGILGLSRIARTRIGSKLFTWFFVLVFTVIVVQMVVAILDPEW